MKTRIRPLLKMFPHYFAENSLNRCSERRSKHEWLAQLFDSPQSKITVFRKSEPLFQAGKKSIAWLRSEKIKQLFPEIHTSSSISKESSPQKTPPLVFLGIDGDVSSDSSNNPSSYWAIQLVNAKNTSETMTELSSQLEQDGCEFSRFRPTVFSLDASEAAIIAQARALLDWNANSIFCSACGSPTISREAGYKRVCLNSPQQSETPSCSTRGAPMNYMHPRTDPVAIVCVVSEDGKSCLLGRKPGWPSNTYSCVAGFLEPGESIEEAARREVFEETGVYINEVKYHSSQPWPFPNSLMVGCIAKATSSDIKGSDEELEDARWFSRETVLEALQSERFRSYDFAASSTPNTEALVLPPSTSIAHQIIKAWAEQTRTAPNL